MVDRIWPRFSNFSSFECHYETWMYSKEAPEWNNQVLGESQSGNQEAVFTFLVPTSRYIHSWKWFIDPSVANRWFKSRRRQGFVLFYSNLLSLYFNLINCEKIFWEMMINYLLDIKIFYSQFIILDSQALKTIDFSIVIA